MKKLFVITTFIFGFCMCKTYQKSNVSDVDTTQSTQTDTTLHPTIYEGVYIRFDENHECRW